MGDFHGFRGRGRSDAKHCKFLQLPAPYLTGKEVEKLMEAARAPQKRTSARPAIYRWKLLLPLWTPSML
jgi:hypothetical protein